MIVVVDYDPAWVNTFDTLRQRYLDALSGVPIVAIEHVGSTSVVGLASKPVIDIDIVVAQCDVAPAAAALERIGYEALGEMGIADRWAFGEPDGTARTNTYVVVEGSVALRNHLGVRDALRAEPKLREEYGALKRRLAANTGDIEVYVEGKSAFISRVLERAGLTDEERLAIENANRRSMSVEQHGAVDI